MNAPRTGIVIVHTSLLAIGKIDGGAETLLDAFIEYFTKNGGVLCIPTHTWSNFYENQEFALDLNNPKTCIGALPTVAAADGRGMRTKNPTHSVCLFGDEKRVKKLVELENKVNTPTSPLGVYGEIIKNGHILLVGVGQDKNTCLHAVEEKMKVENRFAKTPAVMKIREKSGDILEKEFYYLYSEGIEDNSVFFPKYEPAFRYHGGITDGVIGNAKTQTCSGKILASVMELVQKRSNGVEILADDTPLKEEWYKVGE